MQIEYLISIIGYIKDNESNLVSFSIDYLDNKVGGGKSMQALERKWIYNHEGENTMFT